MKSFFFFFFFFYFVSLAYANPPFFPAVVEKAKDSIVKISIHKSKDNNENIGTGFFIDEMTVVTNFHVINRLRYADYPLHLETQSGQEVPFKRIKNFSILHDLALLEVKPQNQPFLELGSTVTDAVYVFGFPGGQFKKFNAHNISRAGIYYVFLPNWVQSLGGASGSPILNSQGKLIGVFSSSFNIERNLSIRQGAGIQVKYLKNLLKKYSLPFRGPKDLISEGLNRLEALALNGNAAAQYKIGKILSGGLSKRKGLDAFGWYQLAARKGYAPAEYTVGMMGLYSLYEESYKYKSNDMERAQALKWLASAAKKGYAAAQYEYGRHFYRDNNYGQALYWFKLSANQGYGEAFYYLKLLADQDISALNHLKSVAEQGYILAQYYMGIFYLKRGDSVEALKWLQSAANQDYIPAQYQLGVLHLKDLPIIVEEGFSFSEKDLCSKKLITFESFVAVSKLEDLDVALKVDAFTKELLEALKWLQSAANQYYVPAPFIATETKWKMFKSSNLLNLAANQGYYSRGAFVEKVFSSSSRKHFKLNLAADQGYASAQYKLGNFSFEKNLENYNKALQWLNLAADQGYAPAQYELGKNFYWEYIKMFFGNRTGEDLINSIYYPPANRVFGGGWENLIVTQPLQRQYVWGVIEEQQGEDLIEQKKRLALEQKKRLAFKWLKAAIEQNYKPAINYQCLIDEEDRFYEGYSFLGLTWNQSDLPLTSTLLKKIWAIPLTDGKSNLKKE